MNNLVPSARWSFRLRVYLGFLPLIFFSFILTMILLIPTMGISIILFLFFLIFVVVVAEIYARLAYKNYLYEFNKSELKVESGIIWKKYTSIPYERVQNVNVSRGIIARIFGFSSVDIETAGSSAGFNSGYRFKVTGFGYNNKQYQAEGHIPAVSIEDAEKIRDFVIKKIKQ